jgi:hypothetical protein
LQKFLHVANGTCTTRLIEAAGIPGRVSIWADVLYEGPVPGGLTDAGLLEVRSRFHGASADPANDMRQWRAAIEPHESYDELVLWYEHDLFDQLNLIQLLSWIGERVPATKTVSLVCVGSFPGRPDFKGLGELTPGELASLLGTRQPVGDAQFSLASQAWTAFREPTPGGLDRLRHADTSALPHLTSAVTRFLEEYPSTVDGLSRTERRLLQLAGGNGIGLATAFPHMHEGEKSYYVTDTSLVEMAEALSSTAPPLLTFDVGGEDDNRGVRGAVTLTDTGRAVLEGRQDRVVACGIDRWFGGVHLEGRGPVWRWDPVNRCVTRA